MLLNFTDNCISMCNAFQRICSRLCPEWQTQSWAARSRKSSEMLRAHKVQLWKLFPTCRWWHHWSLTASESRQQSVHCHRMRQWFHCPWPGKVAVIPWKCHVNFSYKQENSGLTIEGVRRGGFFLTHLLTCSTTALLPSLLPWSFGWWDVSDCAAFSSAPAA